MAVGIKVTGDSGVTQIDDQYKNLRLISTGYCTTGGARNEPYGYASVSYNATYPVFALRPLEMGRAFGVTGCTANGGGSITTQIISGGGQLSLQYYVYDMVPDTTPNTIGIKIMDAQGRTTFDSNYKYLRMLDMMTGYGDRNIGYRSGTVEAAVFCTPSPSQEGGGGYYQIYYNAVQSSNGWLVGGRVDTEYHDTSDNGNNSDQQPTYNPTRLINIIDVAGY